MLVVQSQNNYAEELVLATIKTAPPLTITGMIIYGYTVQDWACIVTIIWVLVQIYLALHNHIAKNRKICPVCKKKH